MDDYKLFEKDEFNCLTPKQKEILMGVSRMMKNNPSSETASAIMKMIPLLEKEGTLTSPQKKAIALCILQNMSEEERSRVLTVFRFAGMI